MSGTVSTMLQYAGISGFIAMVLLSLFYFHRFINTAGRRRRGRDADTGHVDAVTGEQLGLAPDDVAVLPKFTYHAASPGVGKAKAVAADCCAVCIEELREGALVRMLPSCKHYFHASCVDVWLLSRANCPVCRASPGPEIVRQGVASMSPPLPQLRPFGASPMVNNVAASRSPSPVIRPPTHSEVFVHVSSAISVMSPSPIRPMTPESRLGPSSSPSPAMTDPHLTEVV